MKTQLLIDAIVRQTTILIARLSTAEGVRSPLGHVANEVFSGLVAELEQQGVSNKVIADMFGMALRSYRQKVQRLGESATSRGTTLWSAVQDYLSERGAATRAEIVENFRFDEEISVRGILRDLVESGFVIQSGRGVSTTYRPASDEELRDFGGEPEERTTDSLAAVLWIFIYREGPVTLERIFQMAPVSRDELEEALEQLVSDGKVNMASQGDETIYRARDVLIPIGESAGWEAAIVDHHRTVSNAIASKIAGGTHSAQRADEVGGTTLTFDLWPGHPMESQVRQLLSETRGHILPLWDEVQEHNGDAGPAPAGTYQLHFYCGQYFVEEEELP